MKRNRIFKPTEAEKAEIELRIIKAFSLAVDDNEDLHDDDAYVMEDYFDKAFEGTPYRVCVDTGATKGVAIIRRKGNDRLFPYVYKWTSDNLDEGDECERELFIYDEAVKCGLAEFFPATTKLQSFEDGTLVIRQEVVEEVGASAVIDWGGYFNRMTKTVNDMMVMKYAGELVCYARRYNRTRPSDNWVRVCLSVYGKQKMKQLVKFTRKFEINDLHGANLGYTKHRPKILDFSGYLR